MRSAGTNGWSVRGSALFPWGHGCRNRARSLTVRRKSAVFTCQRASKIGHFSGRAAAVGRVAGWRDVRAGRAQRVRRPEGFPRVGLADTTGPSRRSGSGVACPWRGSPGSRAAGASRASREAPACVISEMACVITVKRHLKLVRRRHLRLAHPGGCCAGVAGARRGAAASRDAGGEVRFVDAVVEQPVEDGFEVRRRLFGIGRRPTLRFGEIGRAEKPGRECLALVREQIPARGIDPSHGISDSPLDRDVIAGRMPSYFVHGLPGRSRLRATETPAHHLPGRLRFQCRPTRVFAGAAPVVEEDRRTLEEAVPVAEDRGPQGCRYRVIPQPARLQTTIGSPSQAPSSERKRRRASVVSGHAISMVCRVTGPEASIR